MARRFRRWPNLWTLGFAGLVLLLVFRAWRGNAPASVGAAIPAGGLSEGVSLATGSCRIEQVIDGNTLLVVQAAAIEKDGALALARRYRVRLSGVSLPAESLTGTDARQAAAALKALAARGPARIELDRRRVTSDGCWLAHVYVGETLLAADLLRAGWGKHDIYPGDSAARGRELKVAQQFAERNHLGTWR
ncbi:MAG: hypothetical protein WD872_02655 [Pirellulaceae bacterium]